MTGFNKTKYHLQSRCCGEIFDDKNWELNCPKNGEPSLIRAIYDNKQLVIDDTLPGLYKFASWLPVDKILTGSVHP